MSLRLDRWRIYRVKRLSPESGPIYLLPPGIEGRLDRAFKFDKPGAEHDVYLPPGEVASLRGRGWEVDEGRLPVTDQERRDFETFQRRYEREDAARGKVIALLSPYADYGAAFEVLRSGALTDEAPHAALRELFQDQEDYKALLDYVEQVAVLRRELEQKKWKFNFSTHPPKAFEPPTDGPKGGRPVPFPRSLVRKLFRSFQLQYGKYHNERDSRRYIGRRIKEMYGVELTDKTLKTAIDYEVRD